MIPAVDKYSAFLEKFLNESGSGFLVGKTVYLIMLLMLEKFRVCTMSNVSIDMNS